ncbi:UNVERIFIED_CONTAM: hypothetical protein Sindi_2048100 [Sesamum indicum]
MRVLIERLSSSGSSVSLCNPGRVNCDPPATKYADPDRKMTIMPLMRGVLVLLQVWYVHTHHYSLTFSKCTLVPLRKSNRRGRHVSASHRFVLRLVSRGPKFEFDLQLPEPSCSKSRPGSGSSAIPSESASESASRSESGSASKSVSGSAHGSFSTSPKRNKQFPISKLADKQAGPSVLARFQDRLAKNPWEAVVSKVKTSVLRIREKYHIPSDYDIIIPATFDRMHRPPEGFSVFSIKHLDAELWFPLAPPVAAILNKLGLCPMQLSPNSITHIVLFVVIIQFAGFEPSFDNFWSLYTFTTSKRSGIRGFFYLSAKPECGYLSALKSNVGNEWTKYKPIPKTSGGGLEDDQIRSLTSYKYDPKKLISEKVLQLFGLSLASLHIEESLGDFLFSRCSDHSIVMSSHNASRMQAVANKVDKAKAKGKQVAFAKDQTAKSPLPPKDLPPAPIPPQVRVSLGPADRQPILVDSEGTPSLPLLGYNSSDLELNLDTISGDQRGGKPKKRKRSSLKHGQGEGSKGKESAGPSDPPKSPSPRPKSLSRMAREAADKASQEDERDRFLKLEQLALHWEEARGFAAGSQSQPDASQGKPSMWDSSSSTVLFAEAEGDPFDVYNSLTSFRDQGSLVMTNPVRVEQFGAHAMLQVNFYPWAAPIYSNSYNNGVLQGLTFLRSLSLKCTSYHKNYIKSDKKVQELQARVVDLDNQVLKHADELLSYAEQIKRLSGELDVARKEREIAISEREVALAEGRKDGFDAGREAGLAKGHTRGFEQGQSGRISLEEHQKLLAVVRDFLKMDTFTTALELKSTDSFARGYKTCEYQVEKLGGFQESFDRSRLDITLDGDLQPYPPDPELKDDEFMVLRAELEGLRAKMTTKLLKLLPPF